MGLSDHSKDNRVAIAAVAAGAEVVEKHIALDKQKKGKKRMRQFGKVDIPQNAFLNALKMSDN